ncbi:MAG: NUDIX domain-containing protein [Anaerolineae bacterium]
MGANGQGADAIEGRWLTLPRTLCFVLNGNDILLMKRASHKRVFPNCFNGVGGHIERHEDPLTGARREIKEETGLDVDGLRLRTIHNIDAGADIGIILFVFTAVSSTRETIHNDEGTLHWIPRSQVLGLELVEDLPFLLPKIFSMGTEELPLFAHVEYDDMDQIQIHFA